MISVSAHKSFDYVSHLLEVFLTYVNMRDPIFFKSYPLYTSHNL